MGAKDKLQNKDHTSSEQDYSDQEDEINIQEQVENKIKELPTLKQKVQAIAINYYTEEKRNLDAKLQKQLQQIQLKFRIQFNPFIQEMNKIINGQYQFTDIDFQQGCELLTGEQLANKDAYTKKQSIPQYWLKVFLNSDVLVQQVHQKDQPILKHLQKVQAQKALDSKKLSVYFYFSQNEWFTNTKLSKHFDLQQQDIKKSYGDQINWKQGKNITVKMVKKKGKKGGKKTKEVKQPSFFNFFREIEINEEENNGGDSQNQENEIQDLELQYEIAQNFYQDLIPKSLEYYLDLVPECEPCCEDEECNEAECGSKGVKEGACNKKSKKKVEEQEEDDQ